MKKIETRLAGLVKDLSEQNVKFALIGAVAVGVRAVERMTKDFDFTVCVDSDKQTEELVFALQKRGHILESVLEHKPSGRIATARFIVAGSGESEPGFDLLFHHSGIEKEVVNSAALVEIADVTVPVAAREHLIALKVLSESDLRNRDRDDILRLLERASAEEIESVRALLRLIKERGFSRGKDLTQSFESFLTLLGLR